MKNRFLFILCFLLFACTQEQKKGSNFTIVDSLNYDENAEYTVDIQPFVANTSSSLFCYNRSSYAIEEYSIQTLKHENHIEFSEGNAPSELNNPTSMTMLNGQFVFACPMNKSIKTFRQDGEFDKAVKVEELPFNVYNYNDSIFFSTFPNFPNFCFRSPETKILNLDHIRELNHITPSESYVIKSNDSFYLVNYTEKPHLSLITKSNTLKEIEVDATGKNSFITSFYSKDETLFFILRITNSMNEKHYKDNAFESAIEYNEFFKITDYLVKLNLNTKKMTRFEFPNRISPVRNFLIEENNHVFIQDSFSSIIYKIKYNETE